MTQTDLFYPYSAELELACMALFDANCPQFFAPNERDEYQCFLKSQPVGYQVCLLNDEVVGAFGLLKHNQDYAINWIMLSPKTQGSGVGKQVMKHVIATAIAQGIENISIAASHLSAPFFARFGAVAVNEIEHGWGQGMHRIDMVLNIEP